MNNSDETATYNSISSPAESTAAFPYAGSGQENGFSGKVNQEPEPNTLRSGVEQSLRRYFQNLDNEPVTDLYQTVLREVEAPLLEAVMDFTGNNQSKASNILGLNRGTLRTKLKNYGML